MTPDARWETVQVSSDHKTLRLAVPGGWLYLVNERGELGGILFQHLTFVPKPPVTPRKPKQERAA